MSVLHKNKTRKEKIGTILDSKIVKIIKDRSYKEQRTISDIIENAVFSYDSNSNIDVQLRIAASKRFCSKPFNIRTDTLEKLIAEDYYSQ